MRSAFFTDDELVGWAKERKRRAHHLSASELMDGGHATLCPPYGTYTAASCSLALARFGFFTFDGS